ncbi:hypothetical protein K470DRAFT_265737 [Piedraia hortae CBS 480.64]|uniref:Uncharacterized protein n=1 Tax=Piedraia hortae CBS 480.64 TaxID=1314780 RepID=A0A6A7BUQ0_9PEZI|nr:hypothetical protein K470DRAFT_265737 [Piedraia hortae CBS 480.64]
MWFCDAIKNGYLCVDPARTMLNFSSLCIPAGAPIGYVNASLSVVALRARVQPVVMAIQCDVGFVFTKMGMNLNAMIKMESVRSTYPGMSMPQTSDMVKGVHHRDDGTPAGWRSRLGPSTKSESSTADSIADRVIILESDDDSE